MAGAKAAESMDFARLAEEWENVFPYDDRYDQGYPPRALHALRWLMGMWLTKDQEGFLRAAADGSLPHSYYAAQAMAELMPEASLEWVMRPGRGQMDAFFVECVVRSLAEKHPALYLRMNPEGSTELIPGRGSNDDWASAIAELAQTDAKAAGEACLRWKVFNASRTLQDALLTVAKAWPPGGPPIDSWIDTIQNPMMQGTAREMSLVALAEKDPQEALDRLLQCKGLTGGEAARLILAQLAKADPLGALQLVRNAERQDEGEDPVENENADPFAEPAADPFAERSTEAPTVEEPPEPDQDPRKTIRSEARHALMGVFREDLPDDPTGMLAGLRSLIDRANIHDPVWQQDLEADIIQSESYHWNTSQCLEMAELLASSGDTKNRSQTLGQLASLAAAKDVREALNGAERFPEFARPMLWAEIIQKLPAEDAALRMKLLEKVPTEQWDHALVVSLGNAGPAFAPIVARLPVQEFHDVRGAFAAGWGEVDPDAAAAWVQSLPDDEGAKSAASGLAKAWMGYDGDAATAWALRLPPGAAREGAAKWIAALAPREESGKAE